MKTIVSLGALVVSASVVAGQEVDFNKHVKPILESACVSCHGPEKPKAKFRVDIKDGIMEGIKPGNPKESSVYSLTILPADHDDVMPPKDPLSKEQTEKLRLWIEQGAKWPEGTTLKQVQRIDFVKDVQPILEYNCVACHRADYDKGDVRLDVRSFALNNVVPFEPAKSTVYTTTILPPEDEMLMPPANKGGPMAKEKTEALRLWIEQGAVWPDDLVLQGKKEEVGTAADTPALAAAIYDKIVSNLTVKVASEMKAYTNTIPGTKVNYAMVPIPGGTFLMGTPSNEPGRKPDEAPQHQVKIDPFWMGKYEVTWNEFELFMYPDEEKKAAGAEENPYKDNLSDGVSRPTKPYVEMSFGMGKDGFPAISMTQHAANKFCQWLSAKTGHYYRLPTEAEWEYACRAGTTTAYSWGDDPMQVGDYAWYVENSDWKYQKVGKKNPNPWGLHDMHGNVIEWTLDQYDPDFYQQFKDKIADNPHNWATNPYPHSARGGSWDDGPALLRSGARRASSKAWKQQDPQLPKSVWYHTDAQFLGFRLVRPLKVAPPEQLFKYWTSGVEKD